MLTYYIPAVSKAEEIGHKIHLDIYGKLMIINMKLSNHTQLILFNMNLCEKIHKAYEYH